MRLFSWNVNGLRAILGKNFNQVFETCDADVFCLQETKVSEGQVDLSYPGYSMHWNYAEKKGYSGTAVFTRHRPLSTTRGVNNPAHDTEGRVVTVEFQDFYLVNVYTPNSQNLLARLPYRLQWEQVFKDYVLRLEAVKPVVICGDMNVAHNDIDLKNPKTNRRNPGFTDEERAAFTDLLDSGFVDTFRHLHPDSQRFTWWSYRYNARAKNIGWRIDYFLISKKLLPRLKNADIMEDITGSDHCPVFIELI